MTELPCNESSPMPGGGSCVRTKGHMPAELHWDLDDVEWRTSPQPSPPAELGAAGMLAHAVHEMAPESGVQLIIRLPKSEWERLEARVVLDDPAVSDMADEFDADVREVEHPKVAAHLSALDLVIQQTITGGIAEALKGVPTKDEILAAIRSVKYFAPDKATGPESQAVLAAGQGVSDAARSVERLFRERGL